MLKLPDKYSKKWPYILIAIFGLNFIALLAQSQILNTNINAANIISFAILSLSISLLITVGGFLGGKIYFITASLFDLAGIIYMLYITLNKTAEGWSDLVGIISFLTTIILGLILGLLTQIIYTIITKEKGKSQQ